ncbi:hypothetical protein ACIP98_30590 [Streptomyces sp. NPDC088354]|uniref:hypothetical protein n=1 Tax=unclassified Streptomyces TaxID=2593676 RepID=UPI00380CE7DE
MARIGSGTIVTGLTAAALAAVGVLAVQASSSATEVAAGGAAVSTDNGSASPSSGASAAPGKKHELPAASGSGRRVVYSLRQDRVWLVGDAGAVSRTYVVVPGTVDPDPGTYDVTTRSASGTGGDGVPIEHVVRFASVDNVVVGFSAARDGSLPGKPDPSQQTGGIREKRKDGAALWTFATIDTKVVVVR